MEKMRRWALGGRLGVVLGAALGLALITGGLRVHPAAFSGGGPEAGSISVLMAVALLLLYAAAAIASTRWAGPDVTSAFGEGTRVGLGIAIVWLAGHSLEVFTDAGQSVSLPLFAAIFLMFGAAGFIGARRTGRLRTGVLTALWAGMGSTLILVLYGALVTYVFMSRLQAIDAPDFARSGMHDAAAFSIANMIVSAGTHLLEAPLIAVVFGAIGSAVGRTWFRRSSPSVSG